MLCHLALTDAFATLCATVLGLLGLVERAHSMDDTMSGVHTTTATTTSNMLAVESMAIVNAARLANMLRDYVENWHVTRH